jgi:hypothetical protein
MAKESKNGKMGVYIGDNGPMINPAEKASSITPMEISTKDNGKITSLMGKEHVFLAMD